MIIDGDGDLNKIELDFFLKGNTSLDAVAKEKPYAWMSANGWKDLQKLAILGPAYSNIIQDIESSEKPWKQWYDLEAPEQT
jgi:dynein heavy chain